MDEARQRLAQVLRLATADQVELVWFDSLDRRAATAGRQPPRQVRRHMVTVRAVEGERLGVYTTGADRVGELATAVRQAVAHSRAQPPAKPPPQLPEGSEEPPADDASLLDEELATLAPAAALDLLREPLAPDEVATLRWSEARVVVANSHGLERSARFTTASLQAESGGARAAVAGRSWSSLDLPGLLERARRRRGPGTTAAPPTGAVPLLLAPEATADLLALLGGALGSSPGEAEPALRRRLGEELFHRSINVRDDGTAPGLPFPFDLEGRPRYPLDLITEGRLEAVAVDAALAERLSRPITPHHLLAGEVRPAHLFLLPGTVDRGGLLDAAEDGLWLPSLHHVAPHAPGSLAFRAVVRGARRVAGGQLGELLGDLVWEDDLERLLRQVEALGTEAICRPLGDGLIGGQTAPAVAIAAGGTIRPA